MFVHKNLDGSPSTGQEPKDKIKFSYRCFSLCICVVLLLFSSITGLGFVAGGEVQCGLRIQEIKVIDMYFSN